VAKGCPYQNIELVDFNPASNEHIARVLQQYRGWEPKDFTNSGLVKVEEKILADLPWPECKKLVEYQRLKKLLGYISEGQGAWLKLEKDGRIHGRMHATGTVLNRMSHMSPNLGQVPRVGKPFGAECRELFEASRGKVLVGVDASGLQFRLMAHYLHPYDGGRFTEEVLSGRDVHVYMQDGTGVVRRDNAKTANYAWLFGAGDHKIGTIVIFDYANALELGEPNRPVPSLSQAPSLGRTARRGLEAKLQMGGLVKNLERAAKRGFLRSLDGRTIPVLSKHRALNALLMSGEAAVMKHGLRLAAPEVYAQGGEFVLNVHDEWEVECDPAVAEPVGMAMARAITEAGERLGLRCRLGAKYKVGTNWKETH
jgi:DNA polymerase I-like protein with 3'-5' exonuclease and polymerase domains